MEKSLRRALYGAAIAAVIGVYGISVAATRSNVRRAAYNEKAADAFFTDIRALYQAGGVRAGGSRGQVIDKRQVEYCRVNQAAGSRLIDNFVTAETFHGHKIVDHSVPAVFSVVLAIRAYSNGCVGREQVLDLSARMRKKVSSDLHQGGLNRILLNTPIGFDGWKPVSLAKVILGEAAPMDSDRVAKSLCFSDESQEMSWDKAKSACNIHGGLDEWMNTFSHG